MSRHRFHVATSFLPIVELPGHDTKIQVATSHTAAHVATSKFMSRHRFCPTKANQVATPLPGRDPTPNQTRSRPQIDVATSNSPHFSSGRNPTRSYPAQPGRDTHFWSRPQAAPQGFPPCRNLKIQVATLSSLNQVATSLRCRDFRSPSPGHDMKFMSQPRPTSPSLNQTRSRPQIWVATQRWNLVVAIPASALHQFFFFKSSSSLSSLLLLKMQ